MADYTGVYPAKCVGPNLIEVWQTVQPANIHTMDERNGVGDTLAGLGKPPPHDRRTLACSTFDFTSVYTNITWHNLLRTWEWWKKMVQRLA